MASSEFEHWAIVEIMGHAQTFGKVTEEVVAGHPLLRVDVPAHGDVEAHSEYIGSGSIYRMHIVTEDVVMAHLAERPRKPPMPYGSDLVTMGEATKRLAAPDEMPDDDRYADDY